MTQFLPKTHIPDPPNNANPQSLVASPHPSQYPPIASKEPQVDGISTVSSRTFHARIPLLEPFPRPRLHLQVPTARSRAERHSGQRMEIVRCQQDNYTNPLLVLQDHKYPQ